MFPPLDRNTLMVGALSPVLNQWVADTVAFHHSRLTVAGLVEPGRPTLSIDECRRLAEGFRDMVLRSVQGGQWHVAVPFDAKGLAPSTALCVFPIESLERLSALQKLGLLAGLRLIWPPALAHLDTSGMDSFRHRDTAPPDWPAPDFLGGMGTDDDSDDLGDDDGPPSTPSGDRRRRGPGDKCAIS